MLISMNTSVSRKLWDYITTSDAHISIGGINHKVSHRHWDFPRYFKWFNNDLTTEHIKSEVWCFWGEFLGCIVFMCQQNRHCYYQMFFYFILFFFSCDECRPFWRWCHSTVCHLTRWQCHKSLFLEAWRHSNQLTQPHRITLSLCRSDGHCR